MYQVLTPLKTVKIGPALWMLLEPMKYRTPRGVFTVPAGYLTDHASVPRIFTSVVPPVKSTIAEASILHDWFYNKDSEDVPREFADECLRELIISQGGSKSMAYAAWSAVRLGASRLYNKQYYIYKLNKEAYPMYRGMYMHVLREIFNIKE